jgi:phytoene dehydrogenase-like protein
MSADAALEAECRKLTAYLVDVPPSEYVIACYVRAHRTTSAFEPHDRFERVALRLAALAPGLADAHARLFAPASALRRKLVLLLAILETSSPSFRRVDDPGPRGPLRAWLRLAWIGMAAAGAAVVGSALLLPVHLVLRGR